MTTLTPALETNGSLSSERLLREAIVESITVKQHTYEMCRPVVSQIVEAVIACLERGNKLLIFGNGGSSSDAQHVAGEFVGRFLMERRALPAIALNTDTAILTCVGNDYGYEEVFARQVSALAAPGDVVVGITTSGNSPNVLRGLEAGRAAGAVTIGFTGAREGRIVGATDLCLCVPSLVTARVQETHITVWHVICDAVDRRLFGS